jgi:large subunit ribosomal protein L19
MRDAVIEKLEKEQLKSDIPEFGVGDTVKVHQKIIEGNKERIQVFEGVVIARKGKGISETISIRRVAFGTGMERVFILNSPRIVKIEVTKHGDVRRAKLYYLRGKQGKKARVKSRVVQKKRAPKTVEAPEATPAAAAPVEAAAEDTSSDDKQDS